MRLRPLLAAALLACSAAPALAAQATVTVRPGDGVAPDRILPRSDTFDVFMEGRRRGAPDGQMTLETTRARVDLIPALVRVETVWMQGQPAQVDSFAVSRSTLAPLMVRSWGIGETLSLRFTADRVRGTRQGEHQVDTVDAPLRERAFLLTGMDMVLTSLYLRTGLTARIPAYDPSQGEVAVASAEVLGLEGVQVPGEGNVLAWRVEVRGSSVDGTYWMAREGQALVQFVSADRGMRLVRTTGRTLRPGPAQSSR